MTLFSDSHQRQKIIRVSNMKEIRDKEKNNNEKYETTTYVYCMAIWPKGANDHAPNKFWFSYRTKVGWVQIKSRLHICHRRYRNQNPWGLRR